MLTFIQWLYREALLPGDINTLFIGQLNAIAHRLRPETVTQLANLNWAAYLTTSLRNAGFGGQELDERLHELVTQVIVGGKLFLAWDPNTHGPLEARFRVAVKNAIRDMVKKEWNRRRQVPLSSDVPDYR